MPTATDPNDHVPVRMNQEELSVWKRLPPEARTMLMEADDRLRVRAIFDFMWATLDVDQKGLLGPSAVAAFEKHGALAGWAKVRGLTNRFAALIDFDRHFEVVLPTAKRVMLAKLVALGPQEHGAKGASHRPHWDRVAGKLWLGPEVIREVKVDQGYSSVVRNSRCLPECRISRDG